MAPLAAKRLPRRAVTTTGERALASGPSSIDILGELQLRIGEELRRGPLNAGSARVAFELTRRLEKVLRAGLAETTATSSSSAVATFAGDVAPTEETRCWLCGEAIVAGRLAAPRDVFTHSQKCKGERRDVEAEQRRK